MRSSAFLILIFAAACGDETSEPWILDEIAPAEGFWIRTPEFEVPPGADLQDCYFFRVPDLAGGADLMIDRVVHGLNTGSHHMDVFRVKSIVDLDPARGTPIDLGGVHGTVIRGADDVQCWRSANWSDWPLISNSQQSAADPFIFDLKLPAGVATRLVPGEQLMLQIHYVNFRDEVTPFVGKGGVNFYRSVDGDTQELGTLSAAQDSIRVCRSTPRPSYSGTCAFPSGSYTVAAVNGHFHARGRRFRVFRWDGVSPTSPDDGAMFYDSRTWAEPDMKTGLDIPLSNPGGVWWRCDYQWTEPPGGCEAVDQQDPLHAGDCCYTYGPAAETNEHCILFLYYYPAIAGDMMCS
jgi:hypothetical protein